MLNTVKRQSHRQDAYLGWVEDIYLVNASDGVGHDDDFVVLDLLHPDEVAAIRGGLNFAGFMERPLEQGLKTLPLILNGGEIRQEWRALFGNAMAQPQRRLWVWLADARREDGGNATFVLADVNDEGIESTIGIADIQIADIQEGQEVDRALSSLSYRESTKALTASAVPFHEFLQAILNETTWNEDQLFVGVYNVGQGSASALVDSNEHPRVFFDLGKPIWPFNYTKPSPFPDFFVCDRRKEWPHAPVVLSHWDYDHWAGVLKSSFVREKDGKKYAILTLLPDALQRYWIAPDQEDLELGPTHRELIRQLLLSHHPSSGHSALQYWPHELDVIRFSHGMLLKAIPDANCGSSISEQRNNTGLVMLLLDRCSVREQAARDKHLGILMPGDVRYESIPLQWDTVDLIGLVISHHGGKLGQLYPSASSLGETCCGSAVYNAVCSVGCANASGGTPYDHPDPDTLGEHLSQGWASVCTHDLTACPHCNESRGNRVLSLTDERPRCGCGCVCDSGLCLTCP